MSVPVITPVITSLPNDGIGIPWSYNLVATNTPTSWAVSGLRNGLSVDTSTGLISGTPTAAGHLNCRAVATNGSGDSAPMDFVIIIPGTGAYDGPGVLVDVELSDMSVRTGIVLAAGKDQAAPILYGVTGNTIQLAVGFVRNGALVPCSIASLDLRLKEFEPDPRLLITTGDFDPIDTVNGPRYLMQVDLTSSMLLNVESNYEDDNETAYDALARITANFLVADIPSGDVGPKERSSQLFGVRLSRNL